MLSKNEIQNKLEKGKAAPYRPLTAFPGFKILVTPEERKQHQDRERQALQDAMAKRKEEQREAELAKVAIEQERRDARRDAKVAKQRNQRAVPLWTMLEGMRPPQEEEVVVEDPSRLGPRSKYTEWTDFHQKHAVATHRRLDKGLPKGCRSCH